MKTSNVRPGEAEAILDAFGLEALCDRLVAGDTQTQICKDLKVTKGSLGRWIALDDERATRVREARIAAAETFDEMALDLLANARNTFDLSKKREMASHLRWKASKANPRQYGEKLQVDQTTTVLNLSNEEIARRQAAIDAELARVHALQTPAQPVA